MRYVRPPLLLLVTLLIAACGAEKSKISINNKSSYMLEDVSIRDGDLIWNLGNLPPGSTMNFSEHIPGEGAAKVFYTLNRKRLSYEICYHTGGMPEDGEVIIHNNGVKRTCY